MKKVIFVLVIIFSLQGIASAGTLFGRIIRSDGKPLANTQIRIEGKDVTTNSFGGYRVNGLRDGDCKLTVIIDGDTYYVDRLRIYSPSTKQNWRIETSRRNFRLIKIQ